MSIHFKAGMARLSLILITALTILSVALAAPDQNLAAAAGPATYYVDCNGGKDVNPGTNPAQAWKSLAKANEAPLVAGDSLLFIRGCTWTGTLKAKWNGTATQSVLIGAYGAGNLPRIHNGPDDLDDKYHNNVEITGSYQIIEYLETTIINPPVVAGCKNNPIGFYVGFNFRNPDNLPNGGSYNLLRFSKAMHQMAGAHLNTNTHHNRILKSEFTVNNAMKVLTPNSGGATATDDLGAWGILLKGHDHEVAYNYFAHNNALCTYDTPPQGNSIELYEARNNIIHHNTSFNDRDFSELGGSAAIKSDNNTYTYNLVLSSIRDAHFIITEGGGNGYGPTYRTEVYNNTVYYTGAESQGIVCCAGCSRDILTARNNIIWAEKKAAFADAQFNESNNLYWSANGTPVVQFMNFNLSSTSKIAHPKFVNPGYQNFQLLINSPAINAGVNLGWAKDLAGITLPQGEGNDMGAYEYVWP